MPNTHVYLPATGSLPTSHPGVGLLTLDDGKMNAFSFAMLSAVDFSVWNLFLRADWVVKLVMLTLLLASFWSWAIIFHKFLRYRKVEEKADKFEEVFQIIERNTQIWLQQVEG